MKIHNIEISIYLKKKKEQIKKATASLDFSKNGDEKLFWFFCNGLKKVGFFSLLIFRFSIKI